MSTHPNVILLLTLTPHGLARKTFKAILDEAAVPPEHIDDDGSASVKISGEDYHARVMENDYYESQQISAKEGDLVFFDLVTYGYGEVVAWEALAVQKATLETWAKDICERHACDYAIYVTANYW